MTRAAIPPLVVPCPPMGEGDRGLTTAAVPATRSALSDLLLEAMPLVLHLQLLHVLVERPRWANVDLAVQLRGNVDHLAISHLVAADIALLRESLRMRLLAPQAHVPCLQRLSMSRMNALVYVVE